jgi:hypothetical protein
MSDPFRIFEQGRSKQETLKMLWPELYECLAKLDVPQADRVIRCPVGTCGSGRTPGVGGRAVGRLTRNGTPACRAHLDKLADRPGGWPMKTEYP